MAGRQELVRRGWRPLVAITASYLLVLQLLLAGLAVFGHAAPAQADGLAAVICTPDGLQQAPHDPGAPADRHSTTCCLTSCAGPQASVPPPSAVAAFAVPVASAATRPAPPALRLAGLRHSPSRARAPPSTA